MYVFLEINQGKKPTKKKTTQNKNKKLLQPKSRVASALTIPCDILRGHNTALLNTFARSGGRVFPK